MIVTEEIEKLFDNFKKMLVAKNQKYGSSALEPLNVFSKNGAGDQLHSRIDDSIKRIMYSDELRKKDVARLFGFLALLMIQKGWLEFDDLLD